MKTKILRALGLLMALSMTTMAHAHSIGQTYLYLGLSESGIDVRFEVGPQDFNLALGLDLPTDQALTMADIEPVSQRIVDYLVAKSALAPNGEPRNIVFREHTIRDTETLQFVLSHFVIEGLAEQPEFIDIEYSVLLDEDPQQTGLLVIENDWKSGTFENEAGVSLVFDGDARAQRLDLTGSTFVRGMNAMIGLGTQHILQGIDHVLFLIAILLPAVVRRERGHWVPEPRFSSALWHVAKIVTAFTIAHSITLSLAALEILQVPSRLVESVIAASIAIAAVDVFYPVLGKRIVLVIFLFGLFHGAGFASVILSMNIHPDYVVWTLLFFNVGVELGQLAIVFVVFPLLYLIRSDTRYLRFGMPATASVLIAIAAYWFIERAFDVDLPAGAYAHKFVALVSGG
ncbi:MAG: HupE/UreJ family protein [Gammaproteobacteria bacterium]|nr:HupE/UreJ family protein [Gammaproteobacteria bacterium]